jgi:hypothetical protein
MNLDEFPQADPKARESRSFNQSALEDSKGLERHANTPLMRKRSGHDAPCPAGIAPRHFWRGGWCPLSRLSMVGNATTQLGSIPDSPTKITHGDYYCQRVIGGAESLAASDEDNRQPLPRSL